MRAALALCAWVVGCASPEPASQPAPQPQPAAPAPARAPAPLPDPFAARGVTGAFVLLDVASGKTAVLHDDLAGQRFVPCSTFKIPNTLIGLTTGVIPDERFSLRWDGVERSIADWNRDHDLASAMKYSVVWFYQEVARRVGHERMREQVRALAYGSADIGPPASIDHFWLDGPLGISPREQVDFLRRLHAGELPVATAHRDLVLRLIELDRGPGWVLRGKTGLGVMDDRAVGWLVGSTERDGRLYLYATLLLGDSTDQLKPLRREITEELLRHHGALP